jgi:hypothetical protein
MREPVDFHTHHGAFGAYGSFTLGRIGAGGGFNVHDGRGPARGGIHIGVVRSDTARFLPFSIPTPADLKAFAVELEGKDFREVSTWPAESVERRLGWGTDSWAASEISFRLATPFGPVPDPRALGWDALRPHILPAVWAEMELDNSRSREPALAVFGLTPGDTGAGPVGLPGLVGADLQGLWGVAAPAASGATPFAGFAFLESFGQDLTVATPHWLGTSFGLCWRLEPGERRRMRFALGWHLAGPATSGLSTRYAYNRHWKDLGEILAEAVARTDTAWETARARDAELEKLTPERRWMLAHATRGYFGNSQLLEREDGTPAYVVNEGEYCMMNTLDLSVDQVFFERRFFPWAVREILDLVADRHSFLDRLKVPDRTDLVEGGVSFCHDMGVRNRFSDPGTSSYEKSGLEGCFSHMTFEQACNFALLAGHWSAHDVDGKWREGRRGLLESLVESVERREHPDPALRRGIPGTDSVRCGTGTEITTYDSLDPSLAQARGNLYTTVKLWSAYLGLERALGDGPAARRAAAGARRVERALETWPCDDGVLPALDDGRSRSAILPAVEGLVHPLTWGDADAASPEGRYSELVRILGRHLEAVLESDLCRFPDGGWRISSTSDNSWPSKIWIAQHAAERIFRMPPDAKADAAHLQWLSEGCADWGFTDQIQNGKGIGSKYYPRGVTSILFLDGGAALG